MAKESKQSNNKALIINSIVVGAVALIAGYILGAMIGFGNPNDRYAGTYTTEKWSGHERVSLTLNKDGTCKLPKKNNSSCTYIVKDGLVYFNGETNSNTAIGDDGIVYMDTKFEKLK